MHSGNVICIVFGRVYCHIGVIVACLDDELKRHFSSELNCKPPGGTREDSSTTMGLEV
jgi:hypothetical protein